MLYSNKIPVRSAWARCLLLAMLLLGLAGGSVLLACQVPVFRYALERWVSDPYELVCVPAQGGLKPGEEAALKVLRDAAADEDFPANITVKVDAEGENNSSAARMDLFYPSKMRGFLTKPIWSGDATVENANRVVQSPVRRELTKRILTGQSAIWLLVESGDPKKDDAVEKALIEYAEDISGKLKLPEGVIGKDDVEALQQVRPGDEENVLRSDVPLKIGFSVMRVSRLDPAEEPFLQMLLNLEDDLGEYAAEPMAFPVFGRGRILEPLIGGGITYDNAIESSGYLTGACSCEVKDQNPGIDLLMAMDWDTAMEGSQVVIDKLLPPLEGTAALTKASKEGDPMPAGDHGLAAGAAQAAGGDVGVGADGDGVEALAKEEGMPLAPLALIIGAVMVVLGVGTVVLRKNAD